MEYTVETIGNTQFVRNDDDDIIATFSDETAYIIFVNGMSRHGGISLFNVTKKEYIVGTVDQLDQHNC